jgi:hypothetical protein
MCDLERSPGYLGIGQLEKEEDETKRPERERERERGHNSPRGRKGRPGMVRQAGGIGKSPETLRGRTNGGQFPGQGGDWGWTDNRGKPPMTGVTDATGCSRMRRKAI